ncbi:MAG: isocitrate lyase/phosphoenolpyruvate mutase family protein [Ilumatobacteraceae bacterium]
MTIDETRSAFRALHRPGEPLVMPNAWDAGSAKLFASLGFAAIATTSSGFAATLGRFDGGVSRDEALAHTASLAAATPLPVNADLEDCFADDPAGVAATITAAAAAGAAGVSVEDFTRDDARPIRDIGLATERVTAAVEAARASGLVVTARAENLIHGVRDLDDTIRRLQAFQEAGADVLYAPGLFTIEDVRAVVTSVDRPVNVLLIGGGPDVPALAEAGVARVSVGGTLAWVAWGAVAAAAGELLETGTQGFTDLARAGGKAARTALS